MPAGFFPTGKQQAKFPAKTGISGSAGIAAQPSDVEDNQKAVMLKKNRAASERRDKPA
jgi:hypothetical protein